MSHQFPIAPASTTPSAKVVSSGLDMGTCIAIGVALGAAFDQVALGICLGVAFGGAFQAIPVALTSKKTESGNVAEPSEAGF